MTACELIQEIKTSGGSVELAAGGRIRVTHAPRHLALELKRMKPEIVSHLRLEAARDPSSDAYVFPRCPGCGSFALYRGCGSYALYRATNAGNYECQSCGLEGITEGRARRIE